jgi:hypothetical protein
MDHRQLLEMAHDQEKEKTESRAQAGRQTTSRKIWR